MGSSVLIDSVVRQTIRLITELATAPGNRTSLADVAGGLLATLVTELRDQGLGNKVITDTVHKALRAYDDRVACLGDSHSVSGRSLGDGVLAHVQERRPVHRQTVLAHFGRDDGERVRGVLRELVRSGFLFEGGHGEAVVYSVATAGEQAAMRGPDSDAVGWDAAVLDQYQAAVTAICSKLASGLTRAGADDTVGGSTFHFDVWSGHPLEHEALGLLASFRRQAVTLREAIERHNGTHERPLGAADTRVVAYVGQTVRSDDGLKDD